jgi:hypothetical protein
MKNMNPLQRLFIFLCMVCFILNAFIFPQKPSSNRSFNSNEAFIEGLYTTLDLKDSMSVFKYVFSNLEEEVMVYPSENYYYFRFTAAGKTIWGTLNLAVDQRDNGILGFGYIERHDRYSSNHSDHIGGSKEFNKEDGVIVSKINPMRYSVAFENKTVYFNFNPLSLNKPSKALLRDDEVLVGPNFDESGIQFYLVYNTTEHFFFWILNEDVNIPETFSEINKDIEIGNRTDFAFYRDTLNHRKILIGVDGMNAMLNNWYDGPFDQLPDNYISSGQIEIKKYLMEAYYLDSTEIDQYGNYTDDEGVRVAIAPYYAYYLVDDLVERVEACKDGTASESEFCACITESTFYPPN